MSIEKTEKKTEAVKEAQPVTETTGAAAYCGPTVKGIAPQYTVFVDGLPEKLKEKGLELSTDPEAVPEGADRSAGQARRNAREDRTGRHQREHSLQEGHRPDEVRRI